MKQSKYLYLLLENKRNIKKLPFIDEKIIHSPNWIIDYEQKFILKLKDHLKDFRKTINKYLDLIYKALNQLPAKLHDGFYNILFEKDDNKFFQIFFNLKGIRIELENITIKNFTEPFFIYDINKHELKLVNT